ncbi:MAG TPA: IS4 family transposase [Tepidisphaeraceae bacterium]|nr:IS4 family transposase [Tepidisphaeraceae bacterium]
MANISFALARVRRTGGTDLLPDEPVLQLLGSLGCVWRDRLLTPLVTLRLFVLQILFGNTSITHLRQLSGLDFAPASYCEARQRLRLRWIARLIHWTVDQAAASGDARRLGQRVFVVDCSSFSMPDTPALRNRFGLPKVRGAKVGVTYPIAKFMALLDLASGCFTRLIPGPLYRHEASGVIKLHRQFRSGDILLGDRAFCSFVHVALLSLRGVAACFRLHQTRRSVGRGVEHWAKPPLPPTWMSAAQFARLPASLAVRIVRYTIQRKGYRTHRVAIATTLLDEPAWPDAAIAELYGHRWNIETCFDHLKTTLRMSVLKCQTVGGVLRELLVYLLAYNLIRLAMLRSAADQKVNAHRISFIDAMRWLAARMQGLRGVATLLKVPYRPGRRQPRVIRRRLKEYDWLLEPRAARIARENQL